MVCKILWRKQGVLCIIVQMANLFCFVLFCFFQLNSINKFVCNFQNIYFVCKMFYCPSSAHNVILNNL